MFLNLTIYLGDHSLFVYIVEILLFPFYGCILLHYMVLLQCIKPVPYSWIFGFFPIFCYYKWCCNKYFCAQKIHILLFYLWSRFQKVDLGRSQRLKAQRNSPPHVIIPFCIPAWNIRSACFFQTCLKNQFSSFISGQIPF